MPLKFAILGSGSSGNCAVIRSADTTLLVDAGLSALQIRERLGLLGVDPASLSGIILTHEHGDHTRGLDVLCRKLDVPVFCNGLTKSVVAENVKHRIKWRVVQTGGTFEVGAIKVETFPVPHDAVEPMGFVFHRPGSILGFLSDLGHATHLMRARLAGAHTIFVEANYDAEALMNDLKRPWSTKQRIMSQHGHMSNDQTAQFVSEVAHEGLERVVLGHLSKDCNSPDKARQAVEKAVGTRGFASISVHCAGQDGPTPWFEAREKLAPPPVPAPIPAPTFSRPIPAGPLSQLELF